MGSPVVRRAYRRRFHPTPDQVEQLACTFGCVRYVYDRALAERFRVWLTERRRATHAETDRMLTGWKLESQTAWLATPSRGPWQAIPRDL
ncbi:MAG TPA: helix-turn-helix domain-containing protein [Mycobacteriales bacterium]